MTSTLLDRAREDVAAGLERLPVAILVRVLVFLGTIQLLLCTAHALCPVPEIKANGEFFKADVVFTATVLSEHYREDKGFWLYQVRVGQTFRGKIERELSVFSEDGDNRFLLDAGREYLLFGYRSHGRIWINGCGNSALLSNAAGSLQDIQNIRKAVDCGIDGHLISATDGLDLSGINVVIRSGSHVYHSTTDKGGWFQFRVPPGKYKVDFSRREYAINADDDFWYNPDHFVLHVGEAAALQLVFVRNLAR